MSSCLRWLFVTVSCALAGGTALAEDDVCAQRANDKGLMGKERALFVEECERALRDESKSAVGATSGKQRPNRHERDVSRERTSRDQGAAPALTP